MSSTTNQVNVSNEAAIDLSSSSSSSVSGSAVNDGAMVSRSTFNWDVESLKVFNFVGAAVAHGSTGVLAVVEAQGSRILGIVSAMGDQLAAKIELQGKTFTEELQTQGLALQAEIAHQGTTLAAKMEDAASQLNTELMQQGAVLEAVNEKVATLQSAMDLSASNMKEAVSSAVQKALNQTEGLNIIALRYLLHAIRLWGMNTATGEVCAIYMKFNGTFYVCVQLTLLMEILTRRAPESKKIHGLTIARVRELLFRLNPDMMSAEDASTAYDIFPVDSYNTAAANSATLCFIKKTKFHDFFNEMTARDLSNPCELDAAVPDYKVTKGRGGKSKINTLDPVATEDNLRVYAPWRVEFSREFLEKMEYAEVYESGPVRFHFSGFEITNVPVLDAETILNHLVLNQQDSDGESSENEEEDSADEEKRSCRCANACTCAEAQVESDEVVAKQLGIGKRKRSTKVTIRKPRAKRASGPKRDPVKKPRVSKSSKKKGPMREVSDKEEQEVGADQMLDHTGAGAGADQPLDPNGAGAGADQPLDHNGAGAGADQPLDHNGAGAGAGQMEFEEETINESDENSSGTELSEDNVNEVLDFLKNSDPLE